MNHYLLPGTDSVTKLPESHLSLIYRLIKPTVNILLLLCSCTLFCEADTIPRTNDFVSFFKQAIASPPDIAEFVAAERDHIDENELPKGIPPSAKQSFLAASDTWHYYRGARGGSNYFLRQIERPNSSNTLNESGFIVGHAGPTAYEFSSNTVSYGIGTNAMVSGIQSLSGLIREFLNMGMAEIDTTSLAWNGNNFRALNINGLTRFGKLEVSNNLPYRLAISTEKDSAPSTVINYKYLNRRESVGMYPSTIDISYPDEKDLKIEICLHSIQIANQRLSEDFFSDPQFKGQNITHTNIHSNDVMLVFTKKGKMIAVPKRLERGIGNPQISTLSNRRRTVWTVFAAVSLAFFIIFGWFRKIQSQYAGNANH